MSRGGFILKVWQAETLLAKLYPGDSGDPSIAPFYAIDFRIGLSI